MHTTQHIFSCVESVIDYAALCMQCYAESSTVPVPNNKQHGIFCWKFELPITFPSCDFGTAKQTKVFYTDYCCAKFLQSEASSLFFKEQLPKGWEIIDSKFLGLYHTTEDLYKY
jgi:hypothetical protein